MFISVKLDKFGFGSCKLIEFGTVLGNLEQSVVNAHARSDELRKTHLKVALNFWMQKTQ